MLAGVFNCARADLVVGVGVYGGGYENRGVLLVDSSGLGKKCEIIGRFHVPRFFAMTLRWKVKRGRLFGCGREKMGKVAWRGFLEKGSRVKVAKCARARLGNVAKGTGRFAHEVDGQLAVGCGMKGCDEHFGIPQEAISCIPNIVRTYNC